MNANVLLMELNRYINNIPDQVLHKGRCWQDEKLHEFFATSQYVAEGVTAAPPTRSAGAPEEEERPSACCFCLTESHGCPLTERPSNH